MKRWLVITLGCGCVPSSGQLAEARNQAELAACDLAAVSFLSEDPEQLTIADLRDVIARRKACRNPTLADAGH